MRTVLLSGWLMALVLVGAWHYGPGQEHLHLDDVARVLAQADRHAANGEWPQAEETYAEALRLLPENRVAENRRIRLERAKAQMFARKLPDAHAELKSLVEEMENDPSAPAPLLEEARSALANSRYYMTWLMRLEGQPRESWEPEIEAARQTYRLLAEQAETRGEGDSATRHRQDLESAIRLARLDLSDLQGLPLPSQ